MKSGMKLSISLFALLAAQSAFAQAGEDQGAKDVSNGDIIVTGMRASLSSAQNIKRNAQQLVDSVVAEDIGKLPDNNVVEALQRVPGIQVSPRARGESATVLIRGLPDVVTLVNGRNIFSTTGRSLSLADVPADLVAGVDVYKSRSADQLEGGIAGLINVRTRRPFDFKGFEFALAGREVYSEQPDKIDPYASALISNRWSTGIGEIGALVSVSYHKTRYRDETIYSGGYFGYNLDNSRAPYTPGVPLDPRGTNPSDPKVFRTDVIGAFDRIGTRTRPAVNATLQWAPDDRLTIHADGLFYGYRERGNSNQNFTSMNGTLLSPLVFVDDTKLVQSLSIANGRVANFGGAYQNKADRWQGALGADWAPTGRAAIGKRRPNSPIPGRKPPMSAIIWTWTSSPRAPTRCSTMDRAPRISPCPMTTWPIRRAIISRACPPPARSAMARNWPGAATCPGARPSSSSPG